MTIVVSDLEPTLWKIQKFINTCSSSSREKFHGRCLRRCTVWTSDLKLNNRLFSLTWETNSGGFILFFYPRLPNKDRLLRHSCNFPVVSKPINSRWYITIWWLEGWGEEARRDRAMRCYARAVENPE